MTTTPKPKPNKFVGDDEEGLAIIEAMKRGAKEEEVPKQEKSLKAAKMVMLRLDGEVWEIASGFDTDENSVSVREAKQPGDARAIAAGITHIQSMHGNINAHEVAQLR